MDVVGMTQISMLSTDSKGTHILVVKAGGRVVKKKIALK
jgi:hypothetical protein